MKKICIATAIALLAAHAQSLVSEGLSARTDLTIQGFYRPPNKSCFESGNSFAPIAFGIIEGGANERDLGGSWGSAAAKIALSRTFVTPALAGESALTSGNNPALSLAGDLTPVSLNALFEVALTPLAFLKFEAGAGAGTGWSIGSITGLGMNPPTAPWPRRLNPPAASSGRPGFPGLSSSTSRL